MHAPSLVFGLLLGGLLTGLGMTFLGTGSPRSVSTEFSVTREPESQVGASSAAYSLDEVKPTSAVREVASKPAVDGEVQPAPGRSLPSAPPSSTVLQWSPLERYRELCADPVPEPWPWIEVARGLAEIGAMEPCRDSWWQAYRRAPQGPAQRRALALSGDFWCESLRSEMERFPCSFDERRVMEADLVELLLPEDRLGEAREALQVEAFAKRVIKDGGPRHHTLRATARWRTLAVCDPTTWESLLVDALASKDHFVRQGAIELLVPVWIQQGRDADLRALEADEELRSRHGGALGRLLPHLKDAKRSYEQAPYEAGAILAWADELERNGDPGAADELLHEHLVDSSLDGDDLALLARRNEERYVAILETRLQAALSLPPATDPDADEPLLTLEVVGNSLARLGRRDLARAAFERVMEIEPSDWLFEDLRNLELGRRPK